MTIEQCVGKTLAWIQPKFLSSAYELRLGAEVVGVLGFRNAWGSLATAEATDGCWTFKRLGFLRTRVNIRRCDAHDDLGVFRHATWTGGGTVDFAGGASFRIATNFWHTRYDILDANDQPLVRYKTHQGLRLSADMEILPAGRDVQELSCLAMLGWYLAVMLSRDASAVAATAAVS
jgi:hypothetical protein